MLFVSGSLISKDALKEQQEQLTGLEPHCYFCGSRYVSVSNGGKCPTKMTCLVCKRVCVVEHKYKDLLW